MAFTNQQVDADALPRAAELQLHRLPPEHRREILAQSLMVLAIVLIPTFIPQLITKIPGSVRAVLWLIPITVAGFGALFTALAMIRFRYKGYAMREHDIAFRTGLFWRKTTLLPFDRVQHAEVTQGPLQRRFGLSTLKFFTAGGSSVDLKIEGLLSDQAESLRESVLARSVHAR